MLCRNMKPEANELLWLLEQSHNDWWDCWWEGLFGGHAAAEKELYKGRCWKLTPDFDTTLQEPPATPYLYQLQCLRGPNTKLFPHAAKDRQGC